MIIRLTRLVRNNPFELEESTSPTYNESDIYINPDYIQLMEIDHSGHYGATKITFPENHVFVVKEHPNQIMEIINK